jgi:hypothetical protein
MSNHPRIVGSDDLRRISGKKTAAAVRRWASTLGIPILDGDAGPWTTIDAINAAMRLTSNAANDPYSSDLL